MYNLYIYVQYLFQASLEPQFDVDDDIFQVYKMLQKLLCKNIKIKFKSTLHIKNYHFQNGAKFNIPHKIMKNTKLIMNNYTKNKGN